MTNLEIAELLRSLAAAYQILEENRFKIIAYERAADSIEHLTSEAKDLWDDGKLSGVPGIGKAIFDHLDELFRTGKVRHFEVVMKKIPGAVFPLLSISGLGPKKAYKLVTSLKLNNREPIKQLEKAVKAHKIASIEGFGKKSEADILESIKAYKRGQMKEKRMVLPVADEIANQVVSYLQKSPLVIRVDVLGSLRRQTATIGDIDIALTTQKPIETIDYFIHYPHQKIIEKGPAGASLLLENGRQIDLRVQKPHAYGAMLQYFTGSKNHNIKLRSLALAKGLSLNEYGIKNLRTGKTKEYTSEEELYETLGLTWIPPELREDQGEIELAQIKANRLPKLIETKEIKGDLHVHTDYDLEPSHDLGADSLRTMLQVASGLGYEYLGISDHNPSVTNHTLKQIVDITARRREYYEQEYYSYIKSVQKKSNKFTEQVKLFIMLEVDISADGKLALPSEAFQYVDAVIVSVHSSFNLDKATMTRRIIRALESDPKVRILGHPTGRLLGHREGYEADWPQIFRVCKEREIALEINAYPIRLDLPDNLVLEAVKEGIRMCVNTDAHASGQMNLMCYGVSVARRGWAKKDDIVNCMGYNNFKKWLTTS